MPRRFTPRRMKGMTVVCSSWLLARPMLAIEPRGCVVAHSQASVAPPRLSMAPAHRALSSGRTFSGSWLLSITSVAPSSRSQSAAQALRRAHRPVGLHHGLLGKAAIAVFADAATHHDDVVADDKAGVGALDHP